MPRTGAEEGEAGVFLRAPSPSILVLCAALVFLAAAPAWAYLTIDPSFLKTPLSNKSSADFTITVFPEPGEEYKYVTISAFWPNENEASWQSKSLLVGRRASTSLTVRPRTAGDFVLKVAISGEGVMPQEEYAQVVVEETINNSHLLADIGKYKERISQISRALLQFDREKHPDLYSRLADVNSTAAGAEDSYYDGKYSFTRNALSRLAADVPALEKDMSALKKDSGQAPLPLSFLPRQFGSLSFDLAVLIIILLFVVALTAKAFLF